MGTRMYEAMYYVPVMSNNLSITTSTSGMAYSCPWLYNAKKSWTYMSRWEELTHPSSRFKLPSHASEAMASAGPRPLNDFVFDTITDILTASEIIRRDHASDEVYYHLPNLKATWTVNRRSNSREEIQVYLPPSWRKCLPSQTLFGKRLGRSLPPASHHYTSTW